MRWTGRVLLLVFFAQLFLPAWIVLDFLVDQDRIARELCVQRLVPEQMRTCHGQCYLSKQLRKVDQRERELPAQLRAMKLSDAVTPDRTLNTARDRVGTVLGTCPAEGALLNGFLFASDPVPWA